MCNSHMRFGPHQRSRVSPYPLRETAGQSNSMAEDVIIYWTATIYRCLICCLPICSISQFSNLISMIQGSNHKQIQTPAMQTMSYPPPTHTQYLGFNHPEPAFSSIDFPDDPSFDTMLSSTNSVNSMQQNAPAPADFMKPARSFKLGNPSQKCR